MPGLGDYVKGAKFTLRSGNKPEFKEVGSSPFDGKLADLTNQINQDESIAKQQTSQAIADLGSSVVGSISTVKAKKKAKKQSQELGRLKDQAVDDLVADLNSGSDKTDDEVTRELMKDPDYQLSNEDLDLGEEEKSVNDL